MVQLNKKRVFVIFISALISISAISQDIQYRKDERPQNVKEDNYNQYQVTEISEIDMLKALEMLGIRIFNIPISPAFEKEYFLSIMLDEYVDGKMINSKDIIPNHPALKSNTYRHEQDGVWYFDYIPKMTIFSQDKDTHLSLTVSSLSGRFSGTSLEKKKIREGQFYMWRAYRKKEWKLNEVVPLLVFGSSWHDGRFERFCGTVDLSEDEEATKELLEKSPHYYVLSLKVYE